MRSVALAVLVDDVHLHLAAVHELVGELVIREKQAPDAELVADHRIGPAVPVVEIADQREAAAPPAPTRDTRRPACRRSSPRLKPK